MKPSLLFLHGALGSKKQFESIKDILSPDFDIIDLNFEGHGGVPSNNEFSIQLFTDNAKAFIEKMGREKINIFGYSMGGYVALNLALQNPELVGKIVTLGTKFDWTPDSSAKEVQMLNPSVIEEKVPQFASKLQIEHSPLDWKTVIYKTANMMLDLGKKPPLQRDDFKRINHAVVIGIGSLDRMVSFEESESVSKLLPNATLQTLEDFPHPIDKINPIALSAYIKNSFA